MIGRLSRPDTFHRYFVLRTPIFRHFVSVFVLFCISLLKFITVYFHRRSNQLTGVGSRAWVFVALRYPNPCVASGSGSKMSKVVRGGAALRLNDFSLIYSPFAAGACIVLTPTLGRTKEPPIEEQTIGLFGFSGGKSL